MNAKKMIAEQIKTQQVAEIARWTAVLQAVIRNKKGFGKIMENYLLIPLIIKMTNLCGAQAIPV
jgi:hypothetical protein